MNQILLHRQEGVFYPYGNDDIKTFSKLEENEVYPCEIKKALSKKELRSIQQNRMQFQWYRDMEKQGDQTAQEYRAYCKLHFGVSLLQAEDEEFREVYQRVIRPLDYADKLTLMEAPIDLPVTSRMSIETMAKYLKKVSDHGIEQGFKLTGLEHLTEWLEEDLCRK